MFQRSAGRQIGQLLKSSSSVKRSAVSMGPKMVPSVNFHSSVAKKDEDNRSLAEKYDLTNPTRWVPITVGTFGFLTATGLYHWDEESQLLGLFALFTGTIYAQAGDAIGKMFDDTSDSILAEHQALEDAQIEATRLAMEAHQSQTGVYGDIKEIFEAQKTLMDDIVVAASSKLQHQVRSDFVRKLDTIVSLEGDVVSSARKEIVDSASTHVKAAFSAADADSLKSDALASALAAVADPSSVSQESDPVGAMYKNFFSNFGAKLEETRNTAQDLDATAIKEMEESMGAIARRDNLTDFLSKPDGKLSVGTL